MLSSRGSYIFEKEALAKEDVGKKRGGERKG